jgi:hypothetical protein
MTCSWLAGCVRSPASPAATDRTTRPASPSARRARSCVGTRGSPRDGRRSGSDRRPPFDSDYPRAAGGLRSFCHRQARASALTGVQSGCGFDVGTIALPSGATMRLRPPRCRNRIGIRTMYRGHDPPGGAWDCANFSGVRYRGAEREAAAAGATIGMAYPLPRYRAARRDDPNLAYNYLARCRELLLQMIGDPQR